MKSSNAALIAVSLMTTLSLSASEEKKTEGNQIAQGMGYGMCPRMGYGMMSDGVIEVPEKLPAPKNADWVKKLQAVLDLEKQSYVQYTADRDKYNMFMPYNFVIPQEREHIKVIEKLFSAYGMKAQEKLVKPVDTKSLKEALELCVAMERNLITQYEWLVQNAQEEDSAAVLNALFLQSRWHLAMFEHAISMGGRGMGPGMMRRHMMGPGMRSSEQMQD